MANNEIALIVLLTAATLVPFVVAAGSCFIKFSIVLVLVRNALGIQQVPSNLALNSIALIMSLFVMMPVAQSAYRYLQHHPLDVMNGSSVNDFIDGGLGDYKRYLTRYSDPELVRFFERAQAARLKRDDADAADADADAGDEPDGLDNSLFSLLPAYALTEIKSAFKIGFYLYLPFLVVDMVVSSVLLALGMMMMSPVTISVPIKLILFVAMDGWTLICKGLIEQYLNLMK
ncbi:SctR family type III secretion system export apparatus subunit SpaP [Burkholderia thailandensis]|uniref:Type III secretion system protein BsaW n=1 Tax=Burkholderia thailandensis (strain ATCC 700388 / DSM 13276 / CCUG 48851 / CIP 106301 / E264) TaxID=271848 RepID=Q2T716_BURTA|nr:SctR family type III secretion system export apparatus subunit SpaP [Burkholderia thailandensis]ABC36218.1 type III secretion system protein BsaW [Burkholderia thailandensis E264]AHI67115.1 type III secretion apparatus protein, YscR/HrcR family [Burkholderia thailandensis H0587]AHI75646.1 type III secretion apparatus protein, YscR/HrcR family [Burkholderia thailandensis 2002721723]AHI82267.1 type III secretion apparatus protein, YscR/HrcR family [Burkholderia thailandensis E444]AIC89659.1 t